MTEKVFADTNIVIYAESRHAKKSPAAVAILQASPVISTQVVNETVSVLTRKHGFALTDANQVALSLLDLCEVVPVDVQTVRDAIRVGERYIGLYSLKAAALVMASYSLWSEKFPGDQHDHQP